MRSAVVVPGIHLAAEPLRHSLCVELRLRRGGLRSPGVMVMRGGADFPRMRCVGCHGCGAGVWMALSLLLILCRAVVPEQLTLVGSSFSLLRKALVNSDPSSAMSCSMGPVLRELGPSGGGWRAEPWTSAR